MNQSPEYRADSVTVRLMSALTKRDDLVLAFLFGSFARGQAASSSDLDVAVYFSGPVGFHEVASLREDLSAMLGIETDLLVLNTAPPVIRMQVLRHGTVLVNKDPKVYNTFFVETVKAYDDLKRSRKEIEDNILKGRIYA